MSDGKVAVSKRIPSLDGLRAVSILVVLLSHVIGTRHLLEQAQFQGLVGKFANLGVRVFFVISGFLITSLLLKEQEKTGRISLWNFYVRRTFRIFPAFYAYVLAILVFEKLAFLQLKPGDMIAAATYTMNFHTEAAWYLGHVWSLSVEEQFYLIWPLTVVLAGRRLMPWIAGFVCIAVPLAAIAIHLALPGQPDLAELYSPTNGDSLALGCLLVGVREWLGRQSWYRVLLASKIYLAVPVVAIYIDRHVTGSFALPVLLRSVSNLSIALLMDWCLRFPAGKVGRILNSRPFVFVGVLSYSLYIWQQAFLNRQSSAWSAAFPMNLILVFAVACCSYYVIEQPFLRLKARFERV